MSDIEKAKQAYEKIEQKMKHYSSMSFGFDEEEGAFYGGKECGLEDALEILEETFGESISK